MSTNASYEYLAAEKKYLNAQTLNEKIDCLEEMIRTCPKHKGSENMLAELKRRLKKLTEKQETSSKKAGIRKGIRKEGFQVAIIGLPNTGKSSLLASLTNAKPLIAEHSFTTKEPEIGILNFHGVPIQIIDMPAIGSEYPIQSIINATDLLLILIDSLADIEKITPFLTRTNAKQIFIIPKSDKLTSEQKRKLNEQLKAKRMKGLLISTKTNENIEQLKEMIFQHSNLIRVYTKEPHKPPTKEPIVLPINSSVKDAAEKILKGFSQKVKQTRVTGPSSKFPNQIVGLTHILKDMDIVEFNTK
jgi:small GTP-binding protein